MERVKAYVEDGIGFVLMNDPAHLNPLDIDMDDRLYAALQQFEADEAVKVIVLGGTGRAFSAGGDMRYFKAQLDAGNYEGLDAVLTHVNRLILLMKTMRKLIIAAVQGHAAGGGACLMLAADFVIGEETLKFSVPFTKIGLAPDAGCMYFLSKAVGARRALAIGAEQRFIAIDEAEQLGLVTARAEAGTVLQTAEAYGRRLAAGALSALELAKKQNYVVNYRDFESYLAVTEKETVGAAFRSPDFKEAVHAFLEKRPPQFGKK